MFLNMHCEFSKQNDMLYIFIYMPKISYNLPNGFKSKSRNCLCGSLVGNTSGDNSIELKNAIIT